MIITSLCHKGSRSEARTAETPVWEQQTYYQSMSVQKFLCIRSRNLLYMHNVRNFWVQQEESVVDHENWVFDTRKWVCSGYWSIWGDFLPRHGGWRSNLPGKASFVQNLPSLFFSVEYSLERLKQTRTSYHSLRKNLLNKFSLNVSWIMKNKTRMF